jgi:hypothetical protein
MTAPTAEIKLGLRVASKIQDILLGTVDPLGVIYEDDTAYGLYETASYAISANENLLKAVSLFCSKNCNMKVLEIGAGILFH